MPAENDRTWQVLFISGEYPPMVGGIADYTRALCTALAARGLDVEILTSVRAAARRGDAGTRGRGDAAMGRRGDAGTQGQNDIVDCFPRVSASPRLPVSVSPRLRVRPVVRSWAVAALPALLREIIRAKPDVVHVQYQAAAFDLHGGIHLLPALLRSSRRIHSIATIHDLRIPYLFPKAGALRELANCVLARLVDAVITTNDEDREAVAALGVPTKCIFAIPLGHNIPPGSAAPGDPTRAGAGPAAEPIVGFFGLVNRSKGIETLVDAVASLRQSGRSVRLRIIGAGAGSSDASNAAYGQAVMQRVERVGIGDAVEFVGPLEPAQLSAALRACDVLALPFDDGASLRRTTLLAALAHGAATVTTRPASPEAVRAHGVTPTSRLLLDGDVVRLVTPGSPAELAAAIADLLDHPDQRHELGRRAAGATAHLTWDAIAEAHEIVYRSIIASPI